MLVPRGKVPTPGLCGVPVYRRLAPQQVVANKDRVQLREYLSVPVFTRGKLLKLLSITLFSLPRTEPEQRIHAAEISGSGGLEYDRGWRFSKSLYPRRQVKISQLVDCTLSGREAIL